MSKTKKEKLYSFLFSRKERKETLQKKEIESLENRSTESQEKKAGIVLKKNSRPVLKKYPSFSPFVVSKKARNNAYFLSKKKWKAMIAKQPFDKGKQQKEEIKKEQMGTLKTFEEETREKKQTSFQSKEDVKYWLSLPKTENENRKKVKEETKRKKSFADRLPLMKDLQQDQKRKQYSKERKEQTKVTPFPIEEKKKSTKKITSLPKKKSFADRLPQLHDVRKKRLYQRMSFLIALFFVIILVTLYFISPLSRLEAIQVSGTQHLSKEKMIQKSKLHLHKNIWPQYLKKDKVIRRLYIGEPRLKKATLALTQFNQFEIKIEEYKTKAILEKKEKHYPVLENGVVLEQVANKKERKVVLKNFQSVSQSLMRKFLKAYDPLPHELKEAVSYVTYKGNNKDLEKIQLTMKDGNLVVAQIKTLATNFKKYPQVIEQMPGRGIINMEEGIYSYPYTQKKEKKHTGKDTQTQWPGEPSPSTEETPVQKELENTPHFPIQREETAPSFNENRNENEAF